MKTCRLSCLHKKQRRRTEDPICPQHQQRPDDNHTEREDGRRIPAGRQRRSQGREVLLEEDRMEEGPPETRPPSLVARCLSRACQCRVSVRHTSWLDLGLPQVGPRSALQGRRSRRPLFPFRQSAHDSRLRAPQTCHWLLVWLPHRLCDHLHLVRRFDPSLYFCLFLSFILSLAGRLCSHPSTQRWQTTTI